MRQHQKSPKVPVMDEIELAGAALDCWVALAEGHATPRIVAMGRRTVCRSVRPGSEGLQDFSPATDWALAGPIIQRERIGLRDMVAHHEPRFEAMLRRGGVTWFAQGELPLVAAMRVYVRSRFGDAELRERRFA